MCLVPIIWSPQLPVHWFRNDWQPKYVWEQSSAPFRSERDEHTMSKHAIGLCLLLEDAVQTFCALALRQNPTRQYGSFNETTGIQWTTRLAYMSRNWIASKRPGAWKSLESSAKCWQRGFVLDVEYNRTKLLAYCRHRTEKNSSKLHEQLRALMPQVHNRDGHSIILSTLMLSLLEQLSGTLAW